MVGKRVFCTLFGPLCSDVWSDIHRIRHSKNRDKHPCQLPPHLLERIILMGTEVGDVILDPFLGTGTTALAAIRLDREFIGFEKDKEYCQIAEEKIKAEKFISKIGDCYVSFHLNEIITLRECDWENLKDYFEIPQNIKEIDIKKIKLKTKNGIQTNEQEINVLNQRFLLEA